MSEQIRMRASLDFRCGGEPVERGAEFYVPVEQAIAMLQSGHAVPVFGADARRLADAAGLTLRSRRVRGFIGQR